MKRAFSVIAFSIAFFLRVVACPPDASAGDSPSGGSPTGGAPGNEDLEALVKEYFRLDSEHSKHRGDKAWEDYFFELDCKLGDWWYYHYDDFVELLRKNPNICDYKRLASFLAGPTTIHQYTIPWCEAYCEIVRLLSEAQDIPLKKQNELFARSLIPCEASLALMEDWREKGLERLHVSGYFRKKLERCKRVVAIYREIDRLTPANIRGWSARYLPYYELEIARDKKFAEEIEEARRIVFGTNNDLEKLSEDALDAKGCKFSAMERVILKERRKLLPRECGPPFWRNLFKVHGERFEKVDFDILAALKRVRSIGGYSDSDHPAPKHQVLVFKDPRGVPRYALFFSLYEKFITDMDFYAFIYGGDGGLKDLVSVEVSGMRQEKGELFKMLLSIDKKAPPAIDKWREKYGDLDAEERAF